MNLAAMEPAPVDASAPGTPSSWILPALACPRTKAFAECRQRFPPFVQMSTDLRYGPEPDCLPPLCAFKVPPQSVYANIARAALKNGVAQPVWIRFDLDLQG